jgi:hypothetical protein
MGIVLVLVVTACSDEPGPVGAESSSSTEATTTPVGEDPTTTTESTTTTAPGPTFGFYPDGLGIADFGDPPETVIAEVTAVLGPAEVDTGWVEEFLCPGPLNRLVVFAPGIFDFTLMFTTGGLFAPEGTEHFFSYNYAGNPPVPVSPPDLTVGTTVAQLIALYPEVTFPPNPFEEGVTDYHVDGPGNAQLHGRLTDPGPAGTVVNVQGGIGCGE